MVAQNQTSFHGSHAHFPIEQIAACEVKQGEGILIGGVQFEVDSVV
jgi:hypothetical protein